MTTKPCTRCGQDWPIVTGFRKVGKNRWHSWCRDCETETAGIRQAARYRRERELRRHTEPTRSVVVMDCDQLAALLGVTGVTIEEDTRA